MAWQFYIVSQHAAMAAGVNKGLRNVLSGGRKE